MIEVTLPNFITIGVIALLAHGIAFWLLNYFGMKPDWI